MLKWLITIIVLSISFQIVINETNLSYLSPNFPYKFGMVTTADEYSYFSPAEQFYRTLEWNQNNTGDKAYERTPGYGLIYLCALFISPDHSFLILKIIHVLLFGASIYLFYQLGGLFLNKKLTLYATAFFGFIPCFSGFIYYTLSESIIPFFLIWWVYAQVKKTSSLQSFEIAISTMAIVMIRPQLIVFPLIMFFFHLLKTKSKSLAIFLGLIPFLIWQIRTVTIIGKWEGIHPIYSIKNESIYRYPHKEMTNLFRVWEHDGEVFHNVIGLLSSDTSSQNRIEVLKHIPSNYHKYVTSILYDFQHFTWRQRNSIPHRKTNEFLPGEKKLLNKIITTRKKLINKYFWTWSISTPFKSFKKLIVTSMMNLYIFQSVWRTNWLVVGLKWFCFVIIFSGFILTIKSTLKSTLPELQMIAICVISSLFYLSFFQRMNEERYLYPYLWIFLFFLFHHLQELKKQLFNSRKNFGQ